MLQYIILLLVASCVQGKSPLAPSARIVGGDDTTIESFPHMVSLRRPYEKTEYHFCGGSIISSQYVLTAAHCVDKIDKANITVVAGATRQTARGERYKVDKIIIYEDYNTNDTLINDIALIKVTEDIKFSDKVKTINLPTSDTPGGENLIVTGWGYFSYYRREVYDKLQKLTVKSLSVKDCVEKFDKEMKKIGAKRKFAIVDSNICTYSRYNQGICQGDSGGALIKSKEVVGIVSFNVPCGIGYPDVYTRVYSYLDWIKKNME